MASNRAQFHSARYDQAKQLISKYQWLHPLDNNEVHAADSRYNKLYKRLIDVAGASLLLIVLSPILVIIALIIRVTSKGPALFKQERTGLRGISFTMLKFRSAPTHNDVYDKSRPDQYTTVGKFLRKTSLDELPQLINVIKGEMSFIGPRPWITEYHKHFTQKQKIRTHVRPGITGRAQAFGRNALSIHDKLDHDLHYVNLVSLKEDIRIILQTMRTVGDKSISELGKHGIHQELAELRAQWQPAFNNTEKANDENGTINTVMKNRAKSRELISIVVPVYNAARFLSETIESVQAQTHKNWELILVDDMSSDESIKIIKRYAKNDERIKLVKNKINQGAAITRNNGVAVAKGHYLAFLDADDLWDAAKLQKQISFMKDKNCAFSFTGYEFADSKGKPNGKKVFVPATMTYRQALKNTTIWTSTVMIDLKKLSKSDVEMPNVRSEDTALWWRILKQIPCGYGLNEILSYYRRQSGTQSANKFVAIARAWNLYRNVEKLNIVSSSYNFCWYAYNAVRRRV